MQIRIDPLCCRGSLAEKYSAELSGLNPVITIPQDGVFIFPSLAKLVKQFGVPTDPDDDYALCVESTYTLVWKKNYNAPDADVAGTWFLLSEEVEDACSQFPDTDLSNIHPVVYVDRGNLCFNHCIRTADWLADNRENIIAYMNALRDKELSERDGFWGQ